VSGILSQPVAESGGNYEKMECSICYEKTNVPMKLACNHVFCKPCLKSWYTKGCENGDKCPMCRANIVCRKNYRLIATWDEELIQIEKDELFNEGFEFYAEEYGDDPVYFMHMFKKLQYIYRIAENADQMEEMIGIWDTEDEYSDSESDSESDADLTLPEDFFDPAFFDTLDYDAMSEPAKTKTAYHNEPRTWELSLWYTQYPKLKNIVMN